MMLKFMHLWILNWWTLAIVLALLFTSGIALVRSATFQAQDELSQLMQVATADNEEQEWLDRRSQVYGPREWILTDESKEQEWLEIWERYDRKYLVGSLMIFVGIPWPAVLGSLVGHCIANHTRGGPDGRRRVPPHTRG